jgi:hypothetical protein
MHARNKQKNTQVAARQDTEDRQDSMDKATLENLLNTYYSQNVETMISSVRSHFMYKPHTEVWTGIRDIDSLILLELPDRDLYNICQTSKYLKSLCDTDQFWKMKFEARYGKREVELLSDSSLKSGETKWKRAYKDKVDSDKYGSIYRERQVTFITPHSAEYQEAKRQVNMFIVQRRFTEIPRMSIFKKVYPLKDGDFVNFRHNNIRMLIDIGDFFVSLEILDTVMIKPPPVITAWLSVYSLYELFKHGPVFFKNFVKLIYRQHNRGNQYTKVCLQFNTHPVQSRFTDTKGRIAHILLISYDTNGDPLKSKKPPKTYMYMGMTLVVPYEHTAW